MGERHPTLGYVAPFALYVGLLALERSVPIPTTAFHALRLALVLVVVLAFSLPYLNLRPSRPILSVGIGLAVFLIWVGPDVLFGYRHHWLFENSITGQAKSGIAESLKHDPFFLSVRFLTTAALVPVLEELFWRGWLMRWLIDKNFLKVPLGTYQPFSFWVVALLFASEHGAFWEVGLLAGIVYNWWLVRTRNLADCILSHGVTNLVLGVYVVTAGQWQYWL